MQHNFTLAAYHGEPDKASHSNVLGYIEYSDFQDSINIKNILVGKDYQRRGVATRLMAELKRLNPGKPIHKGMMTPEGSAFFSSQEQT